MTVDLKLFDQLRTLSTEERNKNSLSIDTLSIPQILRVINSEDQKVARVVKKEIQYIAKAVALVVSTIKSGGRLIYVGAGTSGRLGVLDAVECPPTYGTDPSQIQGIIAGGEKAMFHSKEGVEDKEKDGRRDIRMMKVNRRDVICGIAASLRTPYVVAAVREAKKMGARIVYVTNNRRSMLAQPEFSTLRKCIDVAICPMVGPEVIMGSTRMKSGTAQKLVLNMITTAAMIRLGKVYGNMMVDLKMNSKKLRERSKRVLMITTGVNYRTAADYLKKAEGHVKKAIVMILANVSAAEAHVRLRKANGFVRFAVDQNNRNN